MMFNPSERRFHKAVVISRRDNSLGIQALVSVFILMFVNSFSN